MLCLTSQALTAEQRQRVYDGLAAEGCAFHPLGLRCEIHGVRCEFNVLNRATGEQTRWTATGPRCVREQGHACLTHPALDAQGNPIRTAEGALA